MATEVTPGDQNDINPGRDLLRTVGDIAEFLPLAVGVLGALSGLDSTLNDNQFTSQILILMKEMKISWPLVDTFAHEPGFVKFAESAIPIGISVLVGKIRARNSRQSSSIDIATQ